jgi:hypothetical protein
MTVPIFLQAICDPHVEACTLADRPLQAPYYDQSLLSVDLFPKVKTQNENVWELSAEKNILT